MFLFYLESATSIKKKKNLLQVAVSMGACIIYRLLEFFLFSDFVLHNLKCLLYYFCNVAKSGV